MSTKNSTVRAAQIEVNALLNLETTHGAPDARRVLRDERQSLMSTIQDRRSTDADIREATTEAARVRAMWAVAS